MEQMNVSLDDATLRAEVAKPGALGHADRLAAKAVEAAGQRARLGNLDVIRAHAVAVLTRQRPSPATIANPQNPTEVAAVSAYNVARFRHAYTTQAAYEWLASLSDQLLGPISAADCGAARVPATRSLCQAHPVWQSWCASYDAECSRIDAANAAQATASAAAYLADAPRRAIEAAEATGATLGLTADGATIRADRASLIPADVRAQLVQHKAAVVAILTERAAAEIIA